MLKVTIKFSWLSFFLMAAACIVFCSCNQKSKSNTDDEAGHLADSLSEARIDSAYVAIKNECDTALLQLAPVLADSLQAGDSGCVKAYFSSRKPFSDADEKVERVVRQLKSDCDSNLLKETYRRVQLLKVPGSPRHKKRKV